MTPADLNQSRHQDPTLTLAPATWAVARRTRRTQQLVQQVWWRRRAWPCVMWRQISHELCDGLAGG
ncbi:MAG: hypothetical protein H0W01_17865 [Pseudonocardiales bacterium]|nr:hypothetical protein [Pseudonocardiales bacterium]